MLECMEGKDFIPSLYTSMSVLVHIFCTGSGLHLSRKSGLNFPVITTKYNYYKYNNACFIIIDEKKYTFHEVNNK